MQFQQVPPILGNQYDDDRVLRSYLTRVLPGEMLREIEIDYVQGFGIARPVPISAIA